MDIITIFHLFFVLVIGFTSGSQIGKQRPSSDNDKGQSSLRIINGKKVPITKYPYMASLKIEGQIFGSGVIIDKRWILTTAFNVAWYDKSAIELRVGSVKYNGGGVVLETEDIIFHENYTGSWDYDVAVVKVKPIKFGKKVKAIAMATEHLKAGSKANVAGWGETNDTGAPSEYLMAANVTVLDWNTCLKSYKGDLTSRLMCTFDKDEGPCVYDFGDPLVSGDAAAVYGLFAGGHSYVPGSGPVLYTDVASLYDWVKKAISNS